MPKMACVLCDRSPGQPKDGWFWICEDCFYQMDTDAFVGEQIKRTLDKDETITIERIKELIEGTYDIHRRFENVRKIGKALEKGNIGPLVEALPKGYARNRFPEQFDEDGNCKSNILIPKMKE